MFGLFLVPARVAAPITVQLTGGRFVDLTEREAARVIEGLAFLQWVRAGFLGFIGLGVGVLTHRLGGTGARVGEATAVMLVMWLSAYMLLLGVIWWKLHRRGDDDEVVQPVARRRWLLALLRTAPVLSLLLVWPLSIAL